MADKQIRILARILPDNWELLFVDDGSIPEIEIPQERPKNFQILRTGESRQPGEWTQHEAINKGAGLASGHYIIKSDIDHVFTPEAIAAADRFTGDMMLFNRRAGTFANGGIEPLDCEVYSPVDDIWIMRRSLFLELGGYPITRRYGGAGKRFWSLSRQPEAQPPADALIYVIPDTEETYHGLERKLA